MIKAKFYLSRPYVTFADSGILTVILFFMLSIYLYLSTVRPQYLSTLNRVRSKLKVKKVEVFIVLKFLKETKSR